MPIFRYFWFVCAAVMGANVIIWHRLLAERVKRGALEPEEARHFTRGAAFWLVAPCLVLGSTALAAGWSDPFCAMTLSFRDGASAVASLVFLVEWAVLLAWLWLGRAAPMCSRVFSALTGRPHDQPVAEAVVRVAGTVIVVPGLGGAIASRQVMGGCLVLPGATSYPPIPGMQIVFLVLSAATWLIGGNILVAQHYRRLGKSPWSGFQLFAFPFKDFNSKEWLTLLVLGVLSLCFMAVAISFNPP